MHLKSLEINGFKSFAKKGVLEFNTPISAIVGPNGSGKSNTAEAFRFVLGEQSIKSMRGKRGEDLIFNGSKDLPRMNRASVKLIFDNSSRVFNIDFDEVVIERIVYRDSTNQYFINGSQVRLKDILELLAMAHIGASGHHIISQGEADKILNVNLKDRRLMIEDALGLKIYQYKRAESEKKLLKTRENIESAQSLRREIAPHLRFLKKQVEKVERSIEMKNELNFLYKEYFKREDVYIKYQISYIEKNKKPLLDEIRILNEDLAEAKKVLEQSSGDNKKTQELITLEQKLRETRDRKDELTRKLGRMEGMIDYEERRLEKQKRLKEQESERFIKFSEVKIFVNDLTLFLNDAESQIDLLGVRGIVSKIRESISNFLFKNTNSLSAVSENEEDERLELQKLISEKQKIIVEIDEVKSVENEFYVRHLELKREIEKEKDSEIGIERKIFEITSKQNELRSQIHSFNILEDKVNLESDDYKRELNEAVILVGREALNFFDFNIVDGGGNILSEEEVAKEPRGLQEERRRRIEKIKIRLEDMGGSGEEVLKEFNEVKERDEFLEREVFDLEKSAESINLLIEDLKQKLDLEFKEGIKKINDQFQEFFSLMFGGGKAELLVIRETKRKKKSDMENMMGDSEDEIAEDMEDENESGEEGLEVSVSLPNKKVKGLNMLSGGERSLTSIALLFAISQVKPPPFIILDETDAALDEANSRRYGDMIVNLSKYSQLILITHNRETMSRAGILYGVTMGSDGVSKLLSIQLDEAVKVAK